MSRITIIPGEEVLELVEGVVVEVEESTDPLPITATHLQ